MSNRKGNKRKSLYARLRSTMEAGPLLQGSSRCCMELGLFLCALLLGRIRLGNLCAPFGLSVLGAAAFCGIHPLFPGAGVLLGALLEGQPLWGVMIAGAVFSLLLILAGIFVRQPSVSGRLLLFVLTEGAVLPFQIDGTGASAAYALLSAALSVLCLFLLLRCYAIFRRFSLQNPLGGSEQLCLCVLTGLLLLGLRGLEAGNLSLPAVLLYVCMLLLTYARGPGGIGVSVLLGAVLAMGMDKGPELLGTYALTALFCALTAPYGRLHIAAGRP